MSYIRCRPMGGSSRVRGIWIEEIFIQDQMTKRKNDGRVLKVRRRERGRDGGRWGGGSRVPAFGEQGKANRLEKVPVGEISGLQPRWQNADKP